MLEKLAAISFGLVPDNGSIKQIDRLRLHEILRIANFETIERHQSSR